MSQNEIVIGVVLDESVHTSVNLMGRLAAAVYRHARRWRDSPNGQVWDNNDAHPIVILRGDAAWTELLDKLPEPNDNDWWPVEVDSKHRGDIYRPRLRVAVVSKPMPRRELARLGLMELV